MDKSKIPIPHFSTTLEYMYGVFRGGRGCAKSAVCSPAATKILSLKVLRAPLVLPTRWIGRAGGRVKGATSESRVCCDDAVYCSVYCPHGHEPA